MMGSPYYYDIFFDPGDVFHDCMWSGICTCCIQLVHQGPQVNESQDLILCHPPAAFEKEGALLLRDQDLPDKPVKLEKLEYNNNINTTPDKPDNILNNNINNNNNNKQQLHHLHQQQLHLQQQQHHHRQLITSDNIYPKHATSPDIHTNNSSSSSTSSHSSSTSSSSASTPSPSSSSSPPNSSSSTSPKPIRRREHNDSERKRRDHLRNAFNFLRDQVPRFKAINKKPPRIQILHEATKYVQAVMRESEELERRLLEERAKHERLKLT